MKKPTKITNKKEQARYMRAFRSYLPKCATKEEAKVKAREFIERTSE